MNLFRINSHLILTLDDGTSFSTDNCTDEFQEKVLKNVDNKEALTSLFYPEYTKSVTFVKGLSDSKIITVAGESAYIKSISELTLPTDFAKKIIDAEVNKDEDKLTAYLNFWTLLSCNPDSRVRNNLFWFLNKYGMTISKSGLIVAYRNADIKQEGVQFNQELTSFVSEQYVLRRYNNPYRINYLWVIQNENCFTLCEDCDINDITKDNNILILGKLTDLYNTLCEDNSELTTVYTDTYSHTFEIRLGHIVSMPREACDSNQEHTCSSGLHCAGKEWLTQNYFGKVGIKVLVNPADVVGIPTQDNYGKMRTCAYYPISIVKYDETGHIVDDGIESGFEDDFINKICYTGEINNEDNDNYKLDIPNINEVDKDTIYKNLKNIALQYMANRH